MCQRSNLFSLDSEIYFVSLSSSLPSRLLINMVKSEKKVEAIFFSQKLSVIIVKTTFEVFAWLLKT